MLEPISEVLGISIMEILAGERKSESETISREEAQKLGDAFGML